MSGLSHAAELRKARAGLECEPSRRRISADAHVAWGVVAAMTFFIGVTVGAFVRDPAPICRSALPDGRKLQSYDLADSRCDYESPKPKKWRPT